MLRVDPRSDVAPSRQIVDAFLDAIGAEELGAGDRMPSVRQLAADALVNPNTVGRAYRDLEGLGVAEGRNGSGVYVTPDGPALARKLRQNATLAAFENAVRAALRSGHDNTTLIAALEGIASGKQRRSE